MNESVFLSLLALDAYNRGYDQALGGLALPELDDEGNRKTTVRLGSAEILFDSVVLGLDEASNRRLDQSVGFYAIAYEWNGETIISYRGSDFNGDIVADIVNGWPVGAGLGGGAQADLAIRFYEAFPGVGPVFDRSDSRQRVTLTGHSLGGGLAGFVGSLSSNNVFAFDTMPFFEAAIDYALNAAVDVAISAASEGLEENLIPEVLTAALAGGPSNPDLDARSEVFLSVLIAELAANQPALPGALGDVVISSQHLEGEVLEIVRALGVDLSGSGVLPALLTATSQRPELAAALATYGIGNSAPGISTAITSSSTPNYGIDLSDTGIYSPFSSPAPLGDGPIDIVNAVGAATNNAVNLHSASLLTIMLFGEEMWGGTGWTSSIQHIAPAIYDDGVATILLNRQNPVAGAPFDGLAGNGAKVGTAIAYSVLENANNDENYELVFGDTAVRALFDDADNLGNFIDRFENVFSDDTLELLGGSVAEFAGLLASRRIEASSNAFATAGILGETTPQSGLSGQSLFIDLSERTWSQYTSDEFPEAHLSIKGQELIDELINVQLSKILDDAQAVESLLNIASSWKSDIELAVVTAGTTQAGGFTSVNGDLAEPRSASQLIIFDDNSENSANSAAGVTDFNDDEPPVFVISGNGANALIGTNGEDAFFTGNGTDFLVGGDGKDLFAPGTGTATIYGDNQDRTGDGASDTVYFEELGGTQRVTYTNDRLTVIGAQTNATLYDVEFVGFDGGNLFLAVDGNIEAGTNLEIEANEGGAQIANATKARAGMKISIGQDGLGSIEDKDTTGSISLVGFNTTIFGSNFGDTITDLSDEEKTIVGGDGDDVISIAETLPDSVLIGGDGSNQFIGGHGNDVIIDQRSGPSAAVGIELPAFEGEGFPVLGGVQGGFGDDQIVVDIAGLQATVFDGDGGANGPNVGPYLLDPGEGNDAIQLNLNGGVLYRYQRGDGDDRITMRSSGEFGFSDDFNVFPESTIYQSTFAFDLSDYNRDEVTVRFFEQSRQLILRDSPNFDFGDVFAAQGNLVLDFIDGGSVVVEDVFATVSGNYPGFAGIFGGYTFEFADDTVFSAADSLGVEEIVELVSGSAETPSPPSLPDDGEEHAEAAGSHPAEPNAERTAFRNTSQPQSNAGPESEDSDSLQALSLQALSESATEPDEDQEITLERGDFSFVGGSGVDRLVVAWTLDSLVVAHDEGELVISDRWGVLGTTTITNFDEIQVLETDTVYTIQEFLDAVASRQFSEAAIGTDEADTLEGTEARDRIEGLAGDDTIDGLAGDDIIVAGAGDDVVDGSQGDDDLFGNEGLDTLRGGDGNDRLDGGLGDDTLEGGAGDDTFIVDSIGDSIIEEADGGIDRVEASISFTLTENLEELRLAGDGLSGTGNSGNNRIQALGADSTLLGLAGDDFLFGGSGDDILLGGTGDDILRGGAGRDELTGGVGDDLIDGGEGTDTAFFAGLLSDYETARFLDGTVVLTSSQASGDAEVDTVVSVEFLVFEGDGQGIEFDDFTLFTLFGTEGADRIETTFGDETIFALGGDDTIIASASGDTIDGGTGVDTVEYDRLLEDTEIVRNADGSVTVGPNSRGPGGRVPNRDVLTNVELIRFVDSSGNETALVEVTDLPVDGANAGPEVSQPLANINVSEESQIAFSLPADTFVDPEGDTLTLSAILSDGSPLPDWLVFDGANFTGTPPQDLNGAFEITVTASDGALAATDTFTLTLEAVNDAPVLVQALADIEAVPSDTLSIDLATGVFADVDGDALTLTTTLANGDALPAWLTFDGSVLSSASVPNVSGDFDILVTASDGSESTSDTFSLSVAGGTLAPVAQDDGVFVTTSNRELFIDPRTLLENDIDPEGDTLQIISVQDATGGEIGFDDEGFIVFTPDAVFVGDASFTYTISDGEFSSQATVSVAVDPSEEFEDFRRGDDNGNRLLGSFFGGNRILGAGGNDQIFGGFNDDELRGSAGDDALIGNGGDDELYGGQGDDLLDGGEGDDTLDGGNQKDVLIGGDGDDILNGGNGGDRLEGGADNDTLNGGGSRDTLLGGSGDDTLDGGPSNDRLNGGEGADILTGGVGSDLFIFGTDGTVDDADIVTDFELGDEVSLLNTGGKVVSVTQDGGDTIITVDSVLIATVQSSSASVVLQALSFDGDPAMIDGPNSTPLSAIFEATSSDDLALVRFTAEVPTMLMVSLEEVEQGAGSVGIGISNDLPESAIANPFLGVDMIGDDHENGSMGTAAVVSLAYSPADVAVGPFGLGLLDDVRVPLPSNEPYTGPASGLGDVFEQLRSGSDASIASLFDQLEPVGAPLSDVTLAMASVERVFAASVFASSGASSVSSWQALSRETWYAQGGVFGAERSWGAGLEIGTPFTSSGAARSHEALSSKPAHLLPDDSAKQTEQNSMARETLEAMQLNDNTKAPEQTGMARKLMIIRQDMNMFGVEGGPESSHLRNTVPEYLQIFA